LRPVNPLGVLIHVIPSGFTPLCADNRLGADELTTSERV